MKRKQFLKKLGIGATGLYLADTLSSCKKSTITPTPNPPLTVKSPSPNFPILPQLSEVTIIDGYTDKLSYNYGENMVVYINASLTGNFNLTLFDANLNKVDAVIEGFSPQTPGPEPYKNGYQYKSSITYKISKNLKSGLYFWGKTIPFIVKNTEKTGEIVVVFPSNTDNAYNANGGLSSYTTPVMSPILSYQRPFHLQTWSESFWKWAASLNFSIDYIIDSDLDDYSNFSYANLLVIPGHSEYWTRKGRLNFDQFVDSGRNALILSGNTMWWQVRYSDDGTKMICYKSIPDPLGNPELKTVNWFRNELNYKIEKSIGMTFDLGGYGWQDDQGWDGFKIVDGNSPLLAGTGLKTGDILHCLTDEYDGAPVKYISGYEHPVLDNIHNFHKIELVGYDYGFRLVKTVGTFIVLKRTATSGTIVNTGSTDWCSKYGMGGGDSDKIKQVTLNGINLLLSNQNVFSS